MHQRTAARVGIVLAGLGVVLAISGFWLAWGPGHRSLTGLVHDNTLNNAANGVWIPVLAAVLLRLRPDNRIGWLVLALGMANSITIFGSGWALASYHIGLPARAFFAWWAAWAWAPAFLLGSSLLLLVYPSGRTVSRFGHRLAVTALVSAAGLVVGMSQLDATYDSVATGHDLGANPVSGGHLQAPFLVLTIGSVLAGVGVALLTWGHTARRLWRSTSPEREQLAWLIVATVPEIAVAPLNSPWLELVANVLSAVALAIGIVQYQLFDIKPVLSSGLVYGSLTGLSVGAYFAVVGLITTVTPRGPVSTLFGVATVGLLVVPAHRLLQGFFGRLVYGDRSDPLRALHRVGEGMRSGAEGAGLQPMLLGIADAVRSPYVAVRDGTDVVAAVGSVAGAHRVESVRLEYAGTHVGDLVVAGRTPREGLSRRDQRLLAALSGPIAAAVHAARVARDLEESRARVLAVRESERERLRADLHDGVGPSLSGVSLGLEAARGALDGHAERVPEILDVIHHEIGSLVTEVRGIIEDLGPAEPDLLGYLRSQVGSVAASGVTVDLRDSGLSAPIPPAVALAAQRIAGEALTNAVRHAHARNIRVCVVHQGADLVIEVQDDGAGTVEPRPGGIGLTSMRRRAEGLGGSLCLEARPGLGTRVRAVLPCGELS